MCEFMNKKGFSRHISIPACASFPDLPFHDGHKLVLCTDSVICSVTSGVFTSWCYVPTRSSVQLQVGCSQAGAMYRLGHLFSYKWGVHKLVLCTDSVICSVTSGVFTSWCCVPTRSSVQLQVGCSQAGGVYRLGHLFSYKWGVHCRGCLYSSATSSFIRKCFFLISITSTQIRYVQSFMAQI